MVKVAFCGKMTSGKSTATNIALELFPGAYKCTFAGKIYDIAHDLFGMDRKDRQLLIDLGSHMRQIREDVWLDYAVRKASVHEHVIFEDLRFPNEYDRLVQEGYTIIRLNVSRDTQIRRLQELYDDWQEHVKNLDNDSETMLDNYNFQYVIDTDVVNKMEMEILIKNILIK